MTRIVCIGPTYFRYLPIALAFRVRRRAVACEENSISNTTYVCDHIQ